MTFKVLFWGEGICEKDVRKSTNSIVIIKFQEFEERVDRNIVPCRQKNTHKVLNDFSLKIVISLSMKT